MRRFLWALLLAAPVWSEQLTLKDALATAEKASPEVQEARLRTLESEAQALVQKAALMPQLGVNIGVNYQTTNLQGIGVIAPGFPSRVGPYRVFDARPRLTQQVLDLSLLAQYRAAKARAGQAKFDAETTAERTRLAVIQIYLQTLAADSRARAAAARVDTAKAVLAQVGDAEKAGTSSKLDVARATQRIESEQATLVLARRDRDSLLTNLKKTIGMPQSTPVEVVEFTPSMAEPDGGVRPETLALDARRKVLNEEKRQSERERYPKIGAFGDYGVLGQDPANAVSTYTVGVTVSVPVWTSGRIENEIKAARYRLQQLDQQKRALDLAIDQESAQARLERDAAREALQSAARATTAARESLELARLRYGAGLTTNLDVITAQGNLAQTEEEEIRTRYEGLLASANLARARGDVMAFVRSR
ncbi:TolC family protein [uncultured Paludibaculum sp.]|uniref:TolC family protein n=1 Tax=uncultured Paludibaculum sp. TaxID=1765020 RepID=UPI002AAAB1EB|nr:TolC family protein [uncultured Paludibaculum sp.]